MPNNLVIADVGINFGQMVSNIFQPWKPRILGNLKLRQLEENIKDIDLICFGGGEDISPSIYGHRNVASHATNNMSPRDLFESQVFKIAQKNNVPMLGICRGAQLVCALSGGKLIQDFKGNHSKRSTHVMMTDEGTTLNMSSYHHQMMYPFNVNHKLLAWVAVADENARMYAYDAERMNIGNNLKREPEAVYFPDTKALGVQGHPEYFTETNEESQVYTRKIVEQYLLKKVANEVPV